jgi:hypothetical protein
MLRHTSLIACLAGLLCAIAAKATGRHGRQVSQIATAIFLPRPDAIDFVKTASIGESFGRVPRPDAKALGDSVRLEASASGGRRPALSSLHLIEFLLIQR